MSIGLWSFGGIASNAGKLGSMRSQEAALAA
jgi:hypothetical protein